MSTCLIGRWDIETQSQTMWKGKEEEQDPKLSSDLDTGLVV